ncbi:MAG: hypothetical protein LBL06_05215 [Treponema sp.]|nr:hypothetical protein [Treponema sp.]
MDYIPNALVDFLLFLDDLVAAIIANKTRWGVPDDEATDLQTDCTTFKSLFALSENPTTRTSVVIAQRNETRIALIAKTRQMIEFRIRRNPAVTTADLIAMHLKPYSPPSLSPAPSTIPKIEIETPHPRVVRIKFREGGARRRRKPDGIHGLECLWVISEAPPTHISDLLHSAFATRNPLEFSFDEDKRGKRIYFVVRWESGTVKKGLWSDIFSAIIP